MDLLSDAALSDAIGCDVKWMYNSASRLGLSLERTPESAIWWRLVHRLIAALRLPLTDAARAADSLLKLDAEAGRVRIVAHSGPDFGISVDLARFHDGAALALSRALHCTPRRRRGRPRKGGQTDQPAVLAIAPDLAAARLERALEALRAAPPGRLETFERLVEDLTAADAPPTIGGELAASLRCEEPPPITTVRLTCDFREDRPSRVADVLNRAGARPRGVRSRPTFRLDADLVRDAETLSLKIAALHVDLLGSLTPVDIGGSGRDVGSVLIGATTYRVQLNIGEPQM